MTETDTNSSCDLPNGAKHESVNGDVEETGTSKKIDNTEANPADKDLTDVLNHCEQSLYITKNENVQEPPPKTGLKRTSGAGIFNGAWGRPIGEHCQLSTQNLQMLKHEMFDSIANSQMQSIISKTNASSSLTIRNLDSTVSNQPSSPSTDSCSNIKCPDKEPMRAFSGINSHHKESGHGFGIDPALGFDKYFRNMSMYNLRIFTDDNEVWKHLAKRVEPFLDVYSLLMLRQTCKTLYYYKYKLRSHGTLSFRGFAGFDSKWIFDTILPLIHHVLDLPENCKIKFDFTGCVLLKDISTVYLLRSNMINTNLEMRQYARNVRELIFDYCHLLTDKSLEVMLSTKLPYLVRLSLKCCRNENFTGLPFVRDLSSTNWPKFTKFRCQFSNIFLEPLQTIADFIYRNTMNLELQNQEAANGTGQGLRSRASQVDLTKWEQGRERGGMDDIEFEIIGSWGSRRLLEKLGFGIFCTSFTHALKTNNLNMCSKLTKKLQTQLQSLSEQPNMKNNHCVALIANRGSELLVNLPITVKDRSHNNVGIWTLPILLVIHQQNMEMFQLLIKRGARLNVWDSMNKSPLLMACELSLNNFVEKIVKFALAPIPYDVSTNIPLVVAITNSNVELVKLFMKHNFQLNYKCPSIKKYMSPLYVACKHYNPEIIKLLLEYGADPNWKYRRRSTPTLLGYQQDPKILETFLDYGAGMANDKRWVLVQVMACAIVKNDYSSVELLVYRFPDLVEREHGIWSKPLIAVSKLNRVEILEMLLKKNADVNTFDSFGTTALHAACEEANMESIKLLLENSAKMDVQDVFGRTPLHLAIMENKPQVVTVLLEKGAKLDLKEYSYGETALMTAIRTRNENITTMILKTGRVDSTAVDYHGKNVSHYLQFYKMNKLETYLNTNNQSNN